MQDLLDLRSEMDAVLKNLSILRANQKTLDSGTFQASDLALRKGDIPKSQTEAAKYVFASEREMENCDVSSLLNIVESCRICLFLTQLQMELNLRQNQPQGLGECIDDDNNALEKVFFSAVRLKEKLLANGKLPEENEIFINQVLGNTQQSIADIDVAPDEMQRMSSPDLIEAIFKLRLRYVEKAVDRASLECAKIDIQQKRVGIIVKIIENGIIEVGNGFAWEAMEDTRRACRESLKSCSDSMNRIEGFFEGLYAMGKGVPLISDFKPVRYVALPLQRLAPNNP